MLTREDLEGLSTEEQINRAAKYAGVPPAVLDNIWRVESTRGTHKTMVGPETKWGTAKGHFQILDNINANLEKRAGRPLDRMDFTDAVIGASELLRENKAKFGTVEDAVSAFYGGWDRDNWGPLTRKYTADVLGLVGVPASTLPAREPVTLQAFLAGEYKGQDPEEVPALSKALPQVQSTMQPRPVGDSTILPPLQQAAAQAQEERVQRSRDRLFWGGGLQDTDSLVGAAYQQGMQATFRAIANQAAEDKGLRNTEYLQELATNPGKFLEAVPNLTPHERALILDTQSPAEYRNAIISIEQTRKHTETMGDFGVGANLVAGLTVGLLDPVSHVSGVAAIGAAHKLGVGSRALFEAGKGLSGTAALVGESAAGNLLYEAAQQAMGEYRSVADYGMAAAVGGLLALPFAPGAAKAGLYVMAQRAAEAAVRRQAPFILRAVTELGPDAPRADVLARASELEAQSIKKEIDSRMSEAPAEDKIDAPDITADLEEASPRGDTAPEPPLTEPAQVAEAEPLPTLAPEMVPEAQGPHPLEGQTDYTDAGRFDKREAIVRSASPTELRNVLGLTETADTVLGKAPGVHVDPALNIKPEQLSLLQALAAKYLPGVAIHLTDIRITRGHSGAGGRRPDGMHSILGQGHSVLLVNPAGHFSTLVHELGHAIAIHYLPTLPRELATALRRDFEAWRSMPQGPERVQRRMGLSHATKKDTALGTGVRGGEFISVLEAALGPEGAEKYLKYWEHFDEFAAEQFVKQVEKDMAEALEAGLELTIPQQILQQFAQMVDKLKDLFLEFKEKGLLAPTESFQEFFARAAAGDLTVVPPKEAPGSLAPDLTLKDAQHMVDPKHPSWNRMKEWFGDSKIVGEDGEPRLMYHGTGYTEGIIEVFRHHMSGLIFASSDPAFASDFAGGRSSYAGPVYPLYVKSSNPFDPRVPGHRAALYKKIFGVDEQGFRDMREALKDGSPMDVLQVAKGPLREAAEAMGQYGLWVRLRDRETQIDDLFDRLMDGDIDQATHDARVDAIRTEFGKETRDLIGKLEKWYTKLREAFDKDLDSGDSWQFLESTQHIGEHSHVIAEVLEDMGHDGIWMTETGAWNLGVYEPNQLKSAVDSGYGLGGAIQELADPPSATALRYGLDTLPQHTPLEQAEYAALEKLITGAQDYMKRNPQNMDALRSIMDNKLFTFQSPGLILATAEHPVAKQVAALMVENAQGDGTQRKVTAALRKAQYEREFVGNALVYFDQEYVLWRNAKVGAVRGNLDDWTKGNMRREFNEAVALEIEGRQWGDAPNPDPVIQRAADHLEAAWERMRLAQIKTKTLGWGSLPATSRGYMTHKTNTGKFLTMSPEEQRVMRAAFKEQFMGIEGMNEEWADKVAGMYLDHARVNANGGHEIPANVRDPAAVEYVKAAMEAAKMTKEQIDAFAKKMAQGGPSHTKKRLQLDLVSEHVREDGSTFRLLDFFETDHATLIRSQARRVAGEVALAQQGIMGSPGLKLIERALQFWPEGADPAQRARVMEAFQQVAAEMLGRPFGDATPTWADNVLTANAATNLGSMGITQLGESINLATGVGVMGALRAFGSLPRLIAEVRALARGETRPDSILASMELPGGGGEFGMDGYKMVTKWDSPSAVYNTVGRGSMGAFTRAMRRGAHGLGTLSMQRIIQAAQTRGAAEQIVHKALRFIRDGIEDRALQDMGFSPELQARIRAELPRIAEFDESGRLKSLDMRKAEDQDAVGQFTSATLRGASQLIQQSFVGETFKFQHSTLGKMLSQFRTYPLLAMEKQWGRNRNNHGLMMAMMMVAGMAPFAILVHLGRVAWNAQGRSDSEEYIQKMTTPLALGRAVFNYLGMSGMAGDVMDAMTAVMPDDLGEAIGGAGKTGRALTMGNIVPVVGWADQGLRAASNPSNPHAVARALPFSNTPGFIPLVNMLRPE